MVGSADRDAVRHRLMDQQLGILAFMDLPPTDPIPRAAFHLRIVGYRPVHHGDLDTGIGITTLCGKYMLTGNYAKTDDPVTCQVCLRAQARQGSNSPQEAQSPADR